MPASKKHIVAALTISTAFIVFNIIAVTQGTAEAYYTKLEYFLFNLLQTL